MTPVRIPQLHESPKERDRRMQWFRDAKFGMFIHWGPCALAKREIGWGREANRPWDINRHGPRTDDPVYDQLYTSFNPVNYDPDAWARFAKSSGMTYMVLVTKHHDGFSLFDTKLSDYSIRQTPYGRDIVGPFVNACRRHGLKVGLYYSTRDWYHPDYLVGDNHAYDAWYRGQVEELLSQYGPVDMLWFDHVGGRDWGKWRFEDLFTMMYRHQPDLLVNDRAAKFCGPESPEDRPPSSPGVKRMVQGDFLTPEGKIGAMDLAHDWESCIHVGLGWSYRGETGFQGPEDCIRMLVSCTTGGGNLLLNFGPRPDGTFADGEVDVARATGAWLSRYGEAVYGTRGGPYRNGAWGGCCHKGNQLYFHVYQWDDDELVFDPLPRQVHAARTLDGRPVQVTTDAGQLVLRVAASDQVAPVTVIELTLDQGFTPGTLVGDLRSHLQSAPSVQPLFRGMDVAAEGEGAPQLILDLGDAVPLVTRLKVENRTTDPSATGLWIFVSRDGSAWESLLQADVPELIYDLRPKRFHAGIELEGIRARYIKLVPLDPPPGPYAFDLIDVQGIVDA